MQVAAVEHHRRERERLREREHGEEADVDERHAPPRRDLRARPRAVRRVAVALAPERLHDAHAGQPFLQRRHRVRDAVAQRKERRPRALAVPQRRPDEERHRHEHDERELPGERHEDDERDGEEHEGADDVDEHEPRERRERLHVGGQPRDEHAGARLLEEGHREGLELVEGGDAQAAEEPLAGARAREHDHALEHGADQHQDQEDNRDDVDHMRVVAVDPAVDRDLREDRGGERHGGRRHHRDPGDDDQPTLRTEDRPDRPLAHAASSWASASSSR